MSLTRRAFLSSAGASSLATALAERVAFGAMGDTLCRPEDADCVAVQSGRWQDLATWDGKIPQQGDRVQIPAGVTVTNHATTADVLWIHAAGVLTCCDHCDTQINVHTIYVPMGGALRLHSTGRCTVEWLPGPFLPGDSTKLSRGLICHGEFMARGVEKTAWCEVAAECPAGATTVTLPAAPVGWNVGDRIVITGTDSPRIGPKYQTEFRTVTSVNGTTVTFDQPLQFRHWRWRSDLPFWCGNLTRNVVFRSRDPHTIDHRGHLMVMSDMSDVRYVAIEGCGRTDGSRPVTDPRFDAYGEMVLGSDANVRARYALHWHRVGQLKRPGICIGCVADGMTTATKWGFLIHDSVAHLKDCIALRFNGSGFATEEGQERGSIDRCLSLLNRGLGDNPAFGTDDDHRRPDIGDWGIDGSGFWLQGPGVSLTNSAATDNSGRGIALFNGELNLSSRIAEWLRYPIRIHGTLLPIEYGGVTEIRSSDVPVRNVENVWCSHNRLGIQSWSQTRAPFPLRGHLQNLTLYGRGACLHLEYTRDMTVDGLKVINDTLFRPKGSDNGIKQTTGLIIRFPEMTIRGYEFIGNSRLIDERPNDTTHIVTGP